MSPAQAVPRHAVSVQKLTSHDLMGISRRGRCAQINILRRFVAPCSAWSLPAGSRTRLEGRGQPGDQHQQGAAAHIGENLHARQGCEIQQHAKQLGKCETGHKYRQRLLSDRHERLSHGAPKRPSALARHDEGHIGQRQKVQIAESAEMGLVDQG